MPIAAIAADTPNPNCGFPPASSKTDPVEAMANTMEVANKSGDGRLTGYCVPWGSSGTATGGAGTGVVVASGVVAEDDSSFSPSVDIKRAGR